MSFGEHFREGSRGAGRAQGSSGQAVPSWGWHSRAELLYHVQDERFGQMVFPRCVSDSVCNNHLWSAPLDGFLGK